MEIKMLNTAITLSYRYEYADDKFYRTYDTEFVVNADETTTLSQIDGLLTSFCQLKDTHGSGEMYSDKRMITLDKTNKKGLFSARVCLCDVICYDEFMCRTDDFKSFEWYARNIKIEEKAEDFKPVK